RPTSAVELQDDRVDPILGQPSSRAGVLLGGVGEEQAGHILPGDGALTRAEPVGPWQVLREAEVQGSVEELDHLGGVAVGEDAVAPERVVEPERGLALTDLEERLRDGSTLRARCAAAAETGTFATRTVDGDRCESGDWQVERDEHDPDLVHMRSGDT